MHALRLAYLARATAAAVAITSIATSPARAQPTAPPEPRLGLELGGGLTAGNLFCQSADSTKCNGTTAAGGFDLDVAYYLGPSFAIAADVWVMAHTENDFTISQEIGTVGVKWRPAPILMLQAGLGNAHAALSYGGAFTARTDDAPGGMVAAGLDLLRGRRWALSVELRGGAGFYGKQSNGQAQTEARNAGLGVQLSFFGF